MTAIIEFSNLVLHTKLWNFCLNGDSGTFIVSYSGSDSKISF